MIVKLTPQEAVTAGAVGLRRQIFALSKNIQHYGANSENDEVYTRAFDYHIYAAMSEFAAAKVLNLFWAPNVGTIDGGDVGGGVVEVRLRLLPGTGTDLAIRPHDHDEKPYLLVHGRGLTFELVGWLYGAEAKERGKANGFNATRSVWFVPPPYRPLAELIQYLDGRFSFGALPGEAA